jgi:hypothetical protein
VNASPSSGQHHESGTAKRNKPSRPQHPRCVLLQRNLDHHNRDGRGINISGVDFWHAVEFSRNGRFLRTHPRNTLRLSSGRFPSVLRFRLYQTISRSDFLGAFQVPASAFPFPATPTLSDVLGRTDRGPFLNHRKWLLGNRRLQKQTDAHCLHRTCPASRQLFKSTSPHDPCQRLLWGEEDNSRSPQVDAHPAGRSRITPPSVPSRCARLPRCRPSLRPVPRVRPGHRRM